MADKHFTEWVEIENFKCFDSLKAENLRRVNLLGGDNNVGKSAFLEVLEIISKTETTSSLLIALRDSISRRQAYNTRFIEFDVITYEQDNLQFQTNTTSIVLKIKPNPQLSIDTSDKDNEIGENLVAELVVNNSSDMISYNRFSNIINIKDAPSIALRNTRLKENTDFIPSASLDERKLSALYSFPISFVQNIC